MSSITIIHLSDLHINKKQFNDQKIVLDALFDDLRKRLDDGLKPDLIIFSGDLIAKGDYSHENQELVRAHFVPKVLQATGLSNDRLFIAPGNHDFELQKLPDLLRPALNALDCVERTNAMLDNIPNTPYLWDGFRSYNELVCQITTRIPEFSNALFSAHKLNISGMSVGICCINSTWKATGRPNDADYGTLQIGQRQIDILHEKIKDCQVKLAVLHHPLNWLVPFDQHVVQQMLYREFDAIFHGHNHRADGQHIAGPKYSTFVSNAGCLYQSREWFNGYSIVQHKPEESTWKVHVREYYNDRNSYDRSLRYSENGEACFKIDRNAAFIQSLTFPSIDYISAVRDAVNGHLLTSAISDIAPRNLSSLFVPPPLSKISERQLNEDNNNGDELKYLDLTELIASRSAIFFVGQKESGKTTLLHYICSECNDVRQSEVPRFGAYVNLQSVRATAAGILDAIVYFSKGAYRKAEFIGLLKAGRMTICFDNLPVADDKLLQAIASFIRDYNLNKYYFSVSESFQSSISKNVIPKLGLDAAVVYLHSFGRRQTRTLISKWFGDSNETLRGRVDGMLASLRRLNIPRTPFLISILLWVQEKNISFTPVNQAEIIDILVDGILDKLHETKARSGYDSTVKRHFLTELAFHLYQENKTKCSINQLDRLAADYFSNKGLPSSSGQFVEELKTKGVLIDLGGEISFKFDCLRAFFLSIKIKDSRELFEAAFNPDGFVALGEELDYFTGKNRDQKDAIIRALDVVEHFHREANLDFDLSIFDKISMSDSPLKFDQTEL